MVTVSEAASTLIEIPRPELTAAEKVGLVRIVLVASEKSDVDMIAVSTTTSKLTDQTKESIRRWSSRESRLEVEKVTTKPCIALSETPSETASVDLSKSLSLDVGSFSVSIEIDTLIIAASTLVGYGEGSDDGTCVGLAVGKGDGTRLKVGDGVGFRVGVGEGGEVGEKEGRGEGSALGSGMGPRVGNIDGTRVCIKLKS